MFFKNLYHKKRQLLKLPCMYLIIYLLFRCFNTKNIGYFFGNYLINNWVGCRVKNKLIRLQLHTKYSFEQIIEYLKSHTKQSDGSEWRNSKMLKYVETLVQLLGI